MTRIAVLGAGAWGTAMAAVLGARHEVTLWARDAAQADALARTRRNARYLPEIELPAQVAVTAAWPEAADLWIAATPVAGLREVAARVASGPLIWLCKGFESGSGLLPHQVVAQARGRRAPGGALSGPSFALEVARGLPCALTLASANAAFARATARALHGGRLRVYYSADVPGVEVGGAVKNVMAIAVGIADGLALGLNARAALITRGLAEMTRLGVALGGRAHTLMGLAGAGDLILTTTGDLSRNRQVGLALARGEALAGILGRLGHVAEGVPTTREVLRLAARRRIDMPITAAVQAVLEGRLTALQAVEALLARDPKEEARVSARRKSRAGARPRTPARRRRSRG
ncbi:MAG TPA: NAD(P)H-dependent glycerol-3-phosphate dehydrogenase [Burkholderiales bacterium]|nr:NAD(P)H-dependent glycerol-3-phosphate dehydrogenase [Burkholderiales bacterium]